MQASQSLDALIASFRDVCDGLGCATAPPDYSSFKVAKASSAESLTKNAQETNSLSVRLSRQMRSFGLREALCTPIG